MKHTALLLAALLGLSQCQKEADPLSQLPPATQTGANTFGCLVNGKAWTPQGNNSYANYTVDLDPTYRNGSITVAAYRLTGGRDDEQNIGFYSDSARTVGIYSIYKIGRHQAVFLDRLTKCQYYSKDSDTYCKGKFQITRLDPQAGVISGTFEFTLSKPGCDTIKVTNGRFDKKL